MERPTDAYKETHNLTLALDDTLFGGQVSNLQVLFVSPFVCDSVMSTLGRSFDLFPCD